MKVAYFIGSLNRGGTEMLTLDICRKKDIAPYEILLVYRNDGELTEEFRKTGVRMIRLKPKRFGRLRYLFQMRRLLKNEKVDVLHAQTLTNGAFALFITMFSNIKVVNTFHGFHYGWATVPMRHLVTLGCDALCFVSGYVREWYLQRSWVRKNKCFVVYNGIDFSKFDGQFAEPDFLSKIDPPQAGIRLAMVGNFVSGRSQSSLLRSIHRLRGQGVDNFDFYFIGKRSEAEAWRYDDCVKYATENDMLGYVHFVGSRGDVPAILHHIDGFIYSTEHDTFGIAVVEAMACGVPVIANDWAVMCEVMQNGKWGSLYKTDDTDDCARAMKELIDNLKQRKQLAQAQANEVRQYYSIENHINRLNDIYKILVS